MTTVRKVNYSKRLPALNIVQYILAAFIGICFGIGFIPTFYGNVFPVIAVALVIQIIISIARLRFLNIILELILLGLSVISLIPILGYLFRFMGIIASIVELASFKNYQIYKHVEIITFGKNKKKENKKGVKANYKRPEHYEDAKFEEK